MRKTTFEMESKTTVVPIINVSLVVVLTLMMISPFLDNEEVDIDLPEARAAEVDDTDSIELTFTMDREVIIDGDVMAVSDVREYLGTMFDGMDHGVAVVKADRNLPYGEVEALIAEVEAADAPRIALATKEKQGEDSQ